MDLATLQASNLGTLDALRQSPGAVDWRTHPYYGYYTADIFDCPPFLMFTNNDCHRAKDILYRRQFEPASMLVWCRLACTASGIVDIGAQVGVYSLAAASLRKDIPIHAFEPNPHAAARLRLHRMVNGFKNIVEHDVAVGDAAGTVGFSWSKKPGLPISSGGQVGMRDQLGDTVERATVTMTPLDQTAAAAELGIRGLIKIDVEGSENLVFGGMAATVQKRPDIIIETFKRANCDAINAMMLPLGYRAYLIVESTGKLSPQDKLYPRTTNGEDYNQLLTVRPHNELLANLS